MGRPRRIFPCRAEISIYCGLLLEAGRLIFNPAFSGKLQEGSRIVVDLTSHYFGCIFVSIARC